MILIDADQARQFCHDAFMSVGFKPEDARIASEIIVDANLDGLDSHGISRLPIYIQRLKEGRINPHPEVTIHHNGNVMLVDGDNGLGQVVTYKAVETGWPQAKEHGLVAIAIRHSNHFGQAGYYCKLATQHHLFCMLTTNSPKGIPPWGGREPYFGTNPIAFGFPTDGPPVIVDMSSSIVARGKIILANKNKETIPTGWAIDQQGRETTNPAEALKGAVLPFGGAKGYALALSMEILAGILTGAAFGPYVQSIYEQHAGEANVGHFILLSNVSHYLHYNEYLKRISQMSDEIKAIPLREGADQIYIPGERKRITATRRIKEGIPLSPEVYAELNHLAATLGIKRIEECD
ncbi:LDH2 family malate/lactate/ureidoglycolate dehydrogenase [Caldalkalibacillus uzonensis]|uniref:LDH2 family malate/lactate/ureidoglycolate dehydrogenase n=1 Tax=Caldalkalibacillus uzonensis TaxID=353224 RepID=A0ABU0CSE6_9BACI|nr:Ldh family oxidoreductase [Caldalkalibacillus uzonensis]MDQ0337952.1 LDH2 family malate/lactate/ureidoglycolate dehydrogenase [Caldalkalibacillus uzonensis]